MDTIKNIVPKLHLMSKLSIPFTSLGLILKVFTKNKASLGLNAIYARKLPKKIIATNSIDPISLIKVPIDIGSRSFFGGGGRGGVSVTAVLETPHLALLLASMISERREVDAIFFEVFSGTSLLRGSSLGEGESGIREEINILSSISQTLLLVKQKPLFIGVI